MFSQMSYIRLELLYQPRHIVMDKDFKIISLKTTSLTKLHFERFNESWVKQYIRSQYNEHLFIYQIKVNDDQSAEVYFYTGLLHRQYYRIFLTKFMQRTELLEKADG